MTAVTPVPIRDLGHMPGATLVAKPTSLGVPDAGRYLDRMNKRPLAITALCILGTLAALYAAVLFLSTRMWGVPPTTGERAVALAAIALALAALYGMWRMRRWGVVLLATALVARLAYALAAQQPLNVAALAGPGVVLLVGIVYLRRMT